MLVSAGAKSDGDVGVKTGDQHSIWQQTVLRRSHLSGCLNSMTSCGDSSTFVVW